MSQDQQTYRRATSAALLGLAAQLLFAIIIAGLGLYAQSSAIHAAAWHLFGGLPIWLALWMLYNQHRLERAESLEAEQLAQEDARAAALFDEAGHNLATARKRLESFYKWGLNVVSITVAIYLLAAGISMLVGNLGLIERNDEGQREYLLLLETNLGNPTTNPWMLVGFTALLSFLGFLVARYIAGMTRESGWQLLRGGAAYLIGNVLVMVLLLVAAVFMSVGNFAVLAALSLVIPALMVLLGLETLLAFVFGIYRPRRKDEVVRPAFDSRLLGWLTSPESMGKIVSETLNYQFGFEITKSWFYVLLGRALTPLIITAIVILLGLSCVVIVAPNQQAIITDRGAVVKIADPGVSYKLPWPFGRAEKIDVKRSRQLVIGGYVEADRVAGAATLWTNDHVQGEVIYFVTAPTIIDNTDRRSDARERESYDQDGVEAGSPLGGLISMQAVVTWNIGDLAAYRGAGDSSAAASRPEALLSATAQRHLNAIVVNREIDDLLGVGRIAAGEALLTVLRAEMQPFGIAVQDVLLYDIHPPKDSEVAATFLQQVNALQSQQTDIENAQRDAIGILATAAGSRGEALRIEAEIENLKQIREQRETPAAPADLDGQILEQEAKINRMIDEAGGEASRILADARQDRWRTALDEKAQGERFAFELAAHDVAPDYFKSRYYLEAIAEAFAAANRRVISTVPMEDDSTIRLNLEDAGSSADIFANPE